MKEPMKEFIYRLLIIVGVFAIMFGIILLNEYNVINRADYVFESAKLYDMSYEDAQFYINYSGEKSSVKYYLHQRLNK